MKLKIAALSIALLLTAISSANAAKKDKAPKQSDTISLADYVSSSEDRAKARAVKQGKTEEEIAAATQKAAKSATKKFKKADADNSGTLDAEEQKSLKVKKNKEKKKEK